MRAIKKKVSFMLIFVLLANLLLPVMVFAAETIDSVVPSELTNVDNGQTLLSPDTSQWGNQAATPKINGSLNNQQNSNNEEDIANQILEGNDKLNSQTGEVNQAQAAVVAVYFVPGIGQVSILATGAIIVGKAIYKVGSWIYAAVQSYLKDDTARDIINKKKKGSILREFPSEYLDKTLNQIEGDAKKGKKNAKKAKKLLTDKRFDK